MTATLEQTDHDAIGILTDLGETYSIRDLRAMDDLEGLARASAAVARETEEKGDAARHLRDIGALLMIQPWQAAQDPYDAAIARIDAALETGKIKPAESRALKQAASNKRRKAMVGVVYKPIDVYKKTIGVSRGLFARMQHREAALPSPEDYLDQVTQGDDHISGLVAEALAGDGDILAAVAVAASAKRVETDLYDAINEDARLLRDRTIAQLMKGNKRARRRPLINADVSRLTGLTTPRIHQISRGGR